MIARPHVCLRCQLRLAKPRRHTNSKVQVSYQSTATNHEPTLTPSTNDQQQNNDDKEGRHQAPVLVRRRIHGSEDQIAFPPAARQGIKRMRVRKTPLSEYPLGKLYGFGGQMQRESREDLGRSALGEPAEVIVLRDSIVNRYTTGRREIEAEKVESIDIMAALDSERGIVGQDEVFENIDSLRPKSGEEPQNWEQFNGLVHELQSGFTIPQLARYIQASGQQTDPLTVSVKPTTQRKTLVVHQTPWMPGSSGAAEYLDQQTDRGYSFPSHTARQRLAVRLVRECWNLEVAELEEGIGECEVELKPTDYDVLIRGSGSTSALAAISSKYILNRDELIEGYNKRHTIRITASQIKTELIVQEIEKAIRNIKRSQISLGDLVPFVPSRKLAPSQIKRWVDKNFDEPTLTELSLLTRTEIKGLPWNRIVISCIDDKPDSNISNRTDVATRLILTSGEFSNRTTHWLGCRETPGEEDGAFVHYSVTEGFPWRDRLRQWMRWTVPVGKAEKETEPMPLPKISPPVEGGIQEARFNKPTPSDVSTFAGSTAISSPKGNTFWTTKYVVNSSCIMGSVIHSHPAGVTPLSLKELLAADVALSSKVQTTFSTSVPNISRILSSQSNQERHISSTKPVESLMLRFLPNPFLRKSNKSNGSKVLAAYPPIEMHFSVDPASRMTSLQNIQAIVSSSNSDLMLPDACVDIRFQQKVTCKLEVPKRTRLPTGITEFLRKSNMVLRNDHGKFGRIETPPKLTIPIAKHLCRGPDFEEETDPHEMHDVEYLYAGLEIRNTMQMDYEGWQITYTSIESGRAGGRRGELKLMPVRTRPQETQEYREEDFVKAAYGFAESLDEGWVARKVQSLKPTRKVITAKGQLHQPKYFARRVNVWDPETYADEMGQQMREEDEEQGTLEGDKKLEEKPS